MKSSATRFLKDETGVKLAYHSLAGTADGAGGVVFLGGFRSDMSGTKALYLEDLCKTLGCSYVRFDYSGHGLSSGLFSDGTIGQWLSDALLVLDRLTQGPQILVGSSMGGWLMLLAALQRIERIKGLIGIAAAPDFLEDFHRLTPDQAQDFQEKGVCYIPSQYGDPYPITRTLVEEGRQHHLLDKTIAINCPVRLLHGLNDQDVAWQKSIKISEKLTSTDVRITLVKDGDHRLSNDADLALLGTTVRELLLTTIL